MAALVQRADQMKARERPMKIKEMTTCDPFKQIQTSDPAGYAAAFGNTDPAILDHRFAYMFGERTVNPVTVDSQGSFRAYAIAGVWAIYQGKWRRYNELFGLDYDVLKPYAISAKYTKTYKTDDQTTRTGNDSQKVSGFDSESLVDNSATDSTSTTGDKRNQTTETTRETSGNQSGRLVSDLIQGDLELHSRMFFDIVLRDMRSELTLSIYD